MGVPKIAEHTGVSYTFARKLLKALQRSGMDPEQAMADKSISPYKGRPPILDLAGELDIVAQIQYCIAMDKEVSLEEVGDVMRVVAVCRGYVDAPESYPEQRTIKRFLKAYGYTLRKGHLMATNFTRGENIEKIISYAKVWKSVLQQNPICNNLARIYNMDETLVDTSLGQARLFVAAVNAAHGIKRSAFHEERITFVLITGADGTFFPPICVVPRAKMQDRWRKVVPEGTLILLRQTTCTTSQMLVEYIEFFNKCVRARLQDNDPVILVLDGHPSRDAKDHDWLRRAEELNIKILLSPSCTSHFLQPNDQRVNRLYKKAIRTAVDMFRHDSEFIKLSGIEKKLLLCKIVHNTIKAEDIYASWVETEIVPLNFETFAERHTLRRTKFAIQNKYLHEIGAIAGKTGDIEKQLMTEIVLESQGEAIDTLHAMKANVDAHSYAQEPPSIRNTAERKRKRTDFEMLKELSAAAHSWSMSKAYTDENIDASETIIFKQILADVASHLSESEIRELGSSRKKAEYVKKLKVGQDVEGGPRWMCLEHILQYEADAEATKRLAKGARKAKQKTQTGEHSLPSQKLQIAEPQPSQVDTSQ